MQIQQRAFEAQQKQRKRKKGRDSQQESGLLNISQQLQTFVRDQDDSCVEKVKSSTWPLLLSLFLALLLGVVVYRYFCMINNPKTTVKQNTQPTAYLHKDLPYQKNQSPVQLPNQSTKQQKKHNIQTSESLVQQNKIQQTYKDKFPYKLWFFDKTKVLNNNEKLTFNDYSQNWQHYSKLSNLQVGKVCLQNFKTFIINQQIIEIVQKINSLQIEPSVKQNIMQTVIIFSLLQNNGGIIIGGDTLITKPLDSYIKIVQQNPNSTIFLFNSSPDDKGFQIDIKNIFIMARKQSPIINLFLQKIIQTLQSQIKSKSSHSDSVQKWTTNIYDNFQNAFTSLFKSNQSLKKTIYFLGNQKEIKTQNNPFLNIVSINHFKYFYSLQQENLEQLIGPIKPIVQFPSKQYQKFIIEASNEQKSQILKNSFIYQHLLSVSSYQSAIKPIQIKKSVSQQQDSWEIPKIIWTSFTKNHLPDPLHEHFLRNIYEKSKLSGFQLIILTESNIKSILSELQMKQIKSMLQKINQNQNQNAMTSIKEDQILASIIKLKVLSKFGGVFIDHGYFLLQNLQWLMKIKSNQLVFNKRQQQFPQTFMFHKHGDFQWKLNINSGQKQAQELIYSTKFIAATKQSHLIQDWLTQVDKNLMMTKQNLQHKIQSQCQIKEYIFEDIFDVSLQCLLKNSRKIDPTLTYTEVKNSYNIWSIDSLFAGQKMEILTKEDENLCYSFSSAYQDFIKKYGTMGYMSPIETKGSRKQIDLYFQKQQQESIFSRFFSQHAQSKTEGTTFWDHAKRDYIKDVINRFKQPINK